jgi:hypothetical protein
VRAVDRRAIQERIRRPNDQRAHVVDRVMEHEQAAEQDDRGA